MVELAVLEEVQEGGYLCLHPLYHVWVCGVLYRGHLDDAVAVLLHVDFDEVVLVVGAEYEL